MKLTVITDEKGEILGAAKDHVAEPDTSQRPRDGEWRGGLRAGPGQKLHQIEVPDDLEHEDAGEFHKRLVAHVAKHGLG